MVELGTLTFVSCFFCWCFCIFFVDVFVCYSLVVFVSLFFGVFLDFCVWFFCFKMKRWQVERCLRMNGWASPLTFVSFFLFFGVFWVCFFVCFLFNLLCFCGFFLLFNETLGCGRINSRAWPLLLSLLFGCFLVSFGCDFLGCFCVLLFCTKWDVGKLRAMGEWMVELAPLHLSPTSQTPSRFNWLSIEIKHHLDLTDFQLKSNTIYI